MVCLLLARETNISFGLCFAGTRNQCYWFGLFCRYAKPIFCFVCRLQVRVTSVIGLVCRLQIRETYISFALLIAGTRNGCHSFGLPMQKRVAIAVNKMTVNAVRQITVNCPGVNTGYE